jgi:hypothetical protein
MRELFVDIREVQAQAIRWPADVQGKLQLEDMEVCFAGHRVGMEKARGDQHDYRLYPYSFSERSGTYIFGIKEDMTPQCYNANAIIVLDTMNRTVQVTFIGDYWLSLVNDPELAPTAIFKFK